MGAMTGRLPGGGETSGGWLTRVGFFMIRESSVEGKGIGVEMRGELVAPAAHGGRVDRHGRHARVGAELEQRLAHEIENGAVAEMRDAIALVAAAVDADAISLVLD